jgi:hypothetical protein
MLDPRKIAGLVTFHAVCLLALAAALSGMGWSSSSSMVHVWQKKELTFTSARTWANPYTQVTIWVGLRVLGWRAHIPCSTPRDHGWYMEVAKRFQS